MKIPTTDPDLTDPLITQQSPAQHRGGEQVRFAMTKFNFSEGHHTGQRRHTQLLTAGFCINENSLDENSDKHLRKRPAKSRAVRPIPKSSKKHFVGELVFNRGFLPQRLGWGSLMEHNASLCMIYRPDFLDIEEQLAALPFILPNGKPSRHFFDFRFTQKGGRRICISVKPERIATTYKYRAMIAEVKKAAVGNICDDVKTITERNIHPIMLHNATLFHAARDPEPKLDGDVVDCLKGMPNAISIEDFLETSGIGGRGFFSVARALRFGQAHLVNFERIQSCSLIESKAVA